MFIVISIYIRDCVFTCLFQQKKPVLLYLLNNLGMLFKFTYIALNIRIYTRITRAHYLQKMCNMNII